VPVARASSIDPASDDCAFESYLQRDGRLLRRVLRRDGRFTETHMGPADGRLKDPARWHARADALLLRAAKLPAATDGAPTITIVDLFCGIGALSWGAMEAARAAGMRAEVVLAADADAVPLRVYERSLQPRSGAVRCLDLAEALSGSGVCPTAAERAFLHDCPTQIDILVAGPPCQGHSRLNNHTRHDDPRNDLYTCVARFAELRRPRWSSLRTLTRSRPTSGAAPAQRGGVWRPFSTPCRQTRCTLIGLGCPNAGADTSLLQPAPTSRE